MPYVVGEIPNLNRGTISLVDGSKPTMDCHNPQSRKSKTIKQPFLNYTYIYIYIVPPNFWMMKSFSTMIHPLPSSPTDQPAANKKHRPSGSSSRNSPLPWPWPWMQSIILKTWHGIRGIRGMCHV